MRYVIVCGFCRPCSAPAGGGLGGQRPTLPVHVPAPRQLASQSRRQGAGRAARARAPTALPEPSLRTTRASKLQGWSIPWCNRNLKPADFYAVCDQRPGGEPKDFQRLNLVAISDITRSSTLCLWVPCSGRLLCEVQSHAYCRKSRAPEIVVLHRRCGGGSHAAFDA